MTRLAQNEKLLGALAWRLGIPLADVRPDGREPPLVREQGGGGGVGGGGEDEEELDENKEQTEVTSVNRFEAHCDLFYTAWVGFAYVSPPNGSQQNKQLWALFIVETTLQYHRSFRVGCIDSHKAQSSQSSKPSKRVHVHFCTPPWTRPSPPLYISTGKLNQEVYCTPCASFRPATRLVVSSPLFPFTLSSGSSMTPQAATANWAMQGIHRALSLKITPIFAVFGWQIEEGESRYETVPLSQ